MKTGLVLLLPITLIVAACSGATAAANPASSASPVTSTVPAAAEPTPTATPTATPTPTPTPEPTATPTATPTPDPAAEEAQACSDVVGGDIEALSQNLRAVLLQGEDAKHKTFASAKKAAKKPTFKTFFRNAETYDAETVYFKGEVVQALYDQPWGGACGEFDGTATILRVSVTYSGYGFWKDPIYVVYLGSKRVIEDDVVEMVGQGAGITSYESTLGGTITVPSMVVRKWMVIQ